MVASDKRRPPRVLVVDDEESIRTFSERALRDAGYEVLLATDGSDALAVAEAQGPFDLFVVDLVMPSVPGDELGRRLRQLDVDVKVLYFTGYSDRLFKEKTTLWENEAFIEKPVTVRALLEAVSMSLFGHMRGPSTGH
jgi:two-component system, cell cycle sensor histidine kinase and response regulator CckA